MKRKIPEVQKALTVYVDMFARAAEVDREQLQDFLDGYWLLRRLSEYEDAAPAPSLEIRPVSPPGGADRGGPRRAEEPRRGADRAGDD